MINAWAHKVFRECFLRYFATNYSGEMGQNGVLESMYDHPLCFAHQSLGFDALHGIAFRQQIIF